MEILRVEGACVFCDLELGDNVDLKRLGCNVTPDGLSVVLSVGESVFAADVGLTVLCPGLDGATKGALVANLVGTKVDFLVGLPAVGFNVGFVEGIDVLGCSVKLSGRAVGRAEGRAVGREEGRAVGRAEGRIVIPLDLELGENEKGDAETGLAVVVGRGVSL